jgi:outer membrane cobalamin receptor
VHIDQVGGRGGTGSLYLRGADPNYTLVLVNGVRVNDPTNARGGSFDFSTFDVDDIERIEVARGPYSAVFGGDALAGVINIVTRDRLGSSTSGSVDAMVGAYDTREVALRAGDRNWTLGAADSRQGEVVRGNQFESQRVSGSYDEVFGSLRVQLSGRYSETERAGYPDDSGGYEFAEIRATEHRDAHESLFSAALTHQVDQGSLALTLGYFDRAERTDSPGVAPGIRDPFGVPPSVVDAGVARFTTAITGRHDFGGTGIELAYGAEYQHEDGSSDGVLDFGGGFVLPTSFDLTRTSWAPYAEVHIGGPDAMSLQAGVRVDDPEGYSPVTSPRVRVAYGFDFERFDTFTIAGAWGKGFKLPSLYALGHPLVGNPDLVPERSESWELELSQEVLLDTARWSLTWFDSAYRNAIDFDSGPPPMLVNRNRVDSQGFELAGSYYQDGWRLDASVTQARSRIASTGGELRNRPEWSAGAGAQWEPFDGLKLSATASYVGSSFDSSIATGDVNLPAYTLVNVAASWQFSATFEAWLAIDNLTDRQYQQFVGFEVRGILPRAGIRVSL